MKNRFTCISMSILLALILGFHFTGDRAAASASSSTEEDRSPLIEELGEALFFDINLSSSRTQSCASCHDPLTGYTGPDSAINAAGAVMPGAVPTRFGNRKPPTAAYCGDSPLLYFSTEAGGWLGGMFWDGRATGWNLGDPLAEQAMGPFLNPLEQNMANKRLVCIRVANSEYAGLFEEVWGPGSLDYKKDPDGAYERIARSIAAYERSAEINPYSSKFDQFWDNAIAAGKDVTRITAGDMGGGMGGGGGGGGGGMGGGGCGPGGCGGTADPYNWQNYRGLGLTDTELQGLAAFNDPNRADCASCHSLNPGSNGYPLFTDFSYHNLGIPKNPDNPFYTMPKKWNPDGTNWIDQGLGGFLKSAGYGLEVHGPQLGKHKTPTLRNIDLRPSNDFVKAFGHNGFFKSLDGMDGIVHFYAWRAMMDRSGGGGMGGGMGGPNPDLFPPPELDQNRIAMTPFNFMMDGANIVAFLKTLSDGQTEP